MRVGVWPAVGLLALWAFSCSDATSSGQQHNASGNASASGADASTANSAPPDTVLSDDTTAVLGGGSQDAAFVPKIGATNACLSEVREAERVAVDLFVMLDRSSSMLLDAGTGQQGTTKWAAVKTALAEFLADPATSGIGVGLRVFPQLEGGIPLRCHSDGDCGTYGPCDSIPDICGECSNNTAIGCEPGTNCGGRNGQCRAIQCLVGRCAYEPNAACDVGADCGTDPATGQVLGECIPAFGICDQAAFSCVADTYATPDVPITLGATRNDALITALDNTEPWGRTPTGPALEGAIQYASAWGRAHPERVAAVVLTTDGLPTLCATADAAPLQPILDTASAGAALAPEIRTFVIGVFSAAEVQQGATGVAQSIAQAGDTNNAFVVDTAGNVSADLLSALQTISNSAIACDFQLPADDQLDFNAVNLLLTQDTGEEVQLINVGSPAGCASNGDHGWYYVNNPDTGVPVQISVCPAVCQQFSSVGTAGRVDLQIGCETLIR